MTWYCQAGVEAANLTTVMKHYKITPAESNESIKLGVLVAAFRIFEQYEIVTQDYSGGLAMSFFLTTLPCFPWRG